VLVDIVAQGKARKLALEADRNGFGYAVDRATGEFVWATPFVKKVTWTTGINSETGKPNEYDPNKEVQTYIKANTPLRDNPHVVTCPGNMGGKNWPPTAYNPETKLWYIPVIESCNEMDNKETKPGDQKAREFFTGGGPTTKLPITGSVTAVDVTTGKVAAKFETKYPMLGGLLATPELVFAGHPAGEVYALDAKTLDKLWEVNVGTGFVAPPMTYAVNGKQYIAITSGIGPVGKAKIARSPELKTQGNATMLFVFGL